MDFSARKIWGEQEIIFAQHKSYPHLVNKQCFELCIHQLIQQACQNSPS